MTERTPDEMRRLLASMRVAGAPDPHPERTTHTRRVIDQLWEAIEKGLPETMIDTSAVHRAIRTSPGDRSYLTHLLGRVRATWKAAA